MRIVKNQYFVPASSLALLALTFRFDEQRVVWFWSDQPIVALMLGATSVVFWMLLLHSAQRRRG
ncbi:MAG: hypothetical protein KatS3mg126_1689 [Lysobacteraceae bacterium]|nr:MAG: hypothetical protein KatS3mg126_1689 [Xanthomonadaceae bacterium]